MKHRVKFKVICPPLSDLRPLTSVSFTLRSAICPLSSLPVSPDLSGVYPEPAEGPVSLHTLCTMRSALCVLKPNPRINHHVEQVGNESTRKHQDR